MKQIPIFLLLSALLIGFLPSRGDARGMDCFGRGGLICYCCTKSAADECQEAISPCCPCPCPCPCPGSEPSLSFAQDLIMALTVLELNLGAAGFIDTPTLVYRNFFGNAPQKPPPLL